MEVTYAENGRDGIEVLQARPDIDVVLMDIMMPEMDGYETIRQIRATSRLRRAADHRPDGQGDEGRPREVHRGRRLGLHHQAGRHRAAALAAARLALPMTTHGCVGDDGPSPIPAPAGAAPPGAPLEDVEIELLLEGSSATTATTSATTPLLAAAPAPPADARRGARTISGLRSGCCTTRPAWSGCCSASRSTSARCSATRLLPRLPREGRADAAHLPVHPHLARRLLDGRGGLLDGDPAAGGGPLRPLPDLRHRHERGGAAQARDGIFPLAAMQEYTANYIQAGGNGAFSEYYTASYDNAIFRPCAEATTSSSPSTTWRPTARSTSSTSILCRNVMIYFNRALQERVHGPVLGEPGALGFLAWATRSR